MRFRSFAMALGFTSAIAVGSAHADPADFYRGKTFQILVGFSAGGGYDAYARAVGRAIGNHIPGNPRVVVKNMPGGGSLRMVKYVEGGAPRDGLMIGSMDTFLILGPMLKPKTSSFDAAGLTWIGSIMKGLDVCEVWHSSPIKTIDDALKADKLAFGVTGPDDIRYADTAMLRNLFGANIKAIPGYRGSTGVRLAMQQGEIDGNCGDSWSSLKATKPNWLKDKKIKIFLQYGLKRSPELPDVPTIYELAKTDQQRRVLKLLLSPQLAGRPYIAPPDIPQDRTKALRQAFNATMKDPAFLDYTAKAKLDIDPVSGERIQDLIRKVYASPPELIEAARKAIK